MESIENEALENNWRYGQFTVSSEVTGGDGVKHDHSSSPSSSTTPKIRPKLRPIMHLKGHEEDYAITCLEFNPTSNIIVSGSTDDTLKVWSSESGLCLR